MDGGSELTVMESLILDSALYHLTANFIINIDKELALMCRKLSFSGLDGSQMINSNRPIFTWKCANAPFFSLIKYGDKTYVYCHTNDMLYIAAASLCISPECPDRTVFIGQFTFDYDPVGKKDDPKLLLFDFVQFSQAPISKQKTKGKGFVPLAPEDRVAALQAHGHFIPKPVSCILWVGVSRDYTPGFIKRLPHKAECLMMLADSPFEMAVDPKKFDFN